MRLAFRIAIASVATLAGFLLAAEFATGLTKEGNAVGFVADPDLLLVRRPNANGWHWMNGQWRPVRINRHHLRDDELPEERAPDEVRVLCLGDSFTYGGGVDQDDTFPHQMQLRLGPTSASRVRVINGGANGWSTEWQRIFLEKKSAAIDPDVVVLGWNWNDVVPAEGFDRDAAMQRLAGDGCWLCRLGLGRDWLSGTHLYRFVHQRKHGAAKVARDYEAVYRSYRKKQFELGVAPERAAADASERTDTPAFANVREQLRLLARACADRGLRLAVVLLPEPTWDEPGPWPQAARMTALLDQLGVPWLDLQADFQANKDAAHPRGRKEELWQEHDPTHPSALGMAVIAERLVLFLRERDLLHRRKEAR